VVDAGNGVSYTTGTEADKEQKMSLVKQVREHAEQNYNQDGWDFLVECWEDSDILEYIDGVDDLETAINNCRRVVMALDENRREIRATADW
jgi:hypothetical protein